MRGPDDKLTARAIYEWRMMNSIEPGVIAKAAGVSRATVYNWESNRGNPTLRQLLMMENLQEGLLKLMGLAEILPPQEEPKSG